MCGQMMSTKDITREIWYGCNTVLNDIVKDDGHVKLKT